MIDVLLQVKLILLYGIIILSIYTIALLMIGPLKLIGKIGAKLMVGGLAGSALSLSHQIMDHVTYCTNRDKGKNFANYDQRHEKRNGRNTGKGGLAS